MRLQRRQYVLIVLIIAVGSFNFYRMRSARQQQVSAPQSTSQPEARGTSPAWPLFDTAASLRDASDDQFQPALKALTEGIDNTNSTAIPPQTSKLELGELHGCQTWLLFYRAEHLHPTNKPGWLPQTQHHVDSCVANHRDIAQ